MHGVLLTAGLCLLLATMASSTRRVCVYDKEASTRPPFGQFTPAMIDSTLCTHIIFSSANIETHEVVPFDFTDTALYTQLNSLKNSNPQLKTLLSVGGPGFDNQKFSSMVASADNREKFITSAKELIKNNGFNGINLDWQYPGGADSQPQDPTRFLSLCQELRAEFDKEVPALLVSASVSAVKAMIDSSYPDPSALASTMDFMNVLTFKFHDPTESVTAHHSPLGALSSNPSDTLTTEYAMNYWSTTLGVPANKLNMGFAAFGVAFRLADANDNGIGAATSTMAPEEGCYTGQPGIWSYYETCIYIQDGIMRRIPSQSVPYAVTDVEAHWVGYDDRRSIDAKTAHMATEGYGGAFVWALDLDDYSGKSCEDGTFPFIKYLKSKLTATSTITTSTTKATTTTSSSSDPGEFCKGRAGVYANPEDNTTFYNCDHGKGTLRNCPPGLVFKTSCTCCGFP